MLNELSEIEHALRIVGIPITLPHQLIRPLAERPVIRAFITGNGQVERITVIRPEDAVHFWRLGDNQKKFPLVNLGPRDDARKGKVRQPIPLRPRADKKILAVVLSRSAPLNERGEALRSLFRSTSPQLAPFLPWPEHREWLSELRNRLAIAASTTVGRVVRLFDLALYDHDGQSLLASLDAALRQEVELPVSAEAIDVIAKAAFCGGGEILLDTVDGQCRNACDPRNQEHVVAALDASEPPTRRGRCSFTGEEGFLWEGAFPRVRLPVIQDVPLFDKNPDIPSAKRYLRVGCNGCLVSRNHVRRLAGAIQTLVTPHHQKEGKTWSALTSERPTRKGKKPPPKDLLLTYVDASNDLRLGGAMTTDPALLESLSADVHKLTKGHHVDYSTCTRLIVIRKLNKGNHKVISSTSATLEELAQAADHWTVGCRNIPAEFMQLPVPEGKDRPARWRGPGLIVPAAIVTLGKSVFVHGGTRRQESPGPTFADAMCLFLGTKSQQHHMGERLLALFLARRGSLVAGTAHARRRLSPAKAQDRKELNAYDNSATLDTMSVFALLLHTLGRNMETYMNDTAFQLGQLLSGADALHRGYCEHQRGGSIPAALLGNQMLAIAQRSPVAAVEQLCQRWRVYAGWADKYRGKIARPEDGAGQDQWAVYNAVWSPVNMRPLCESLRGTLPKDANTRFRAELLLGYIAGLPRPAKNEPGNVQHGTNTQETTPED